MKRILIGLAGLVILVAALAFVFGPAYLEKSVNRIAGHAPYAVAEESAALHNRLVVADLHSDTLLWDRNPLTRASRGHVDVPRLMDGNVTVAHRARFLDTDR